MEAQTSPSAATPGAPSPAPSRPPARRRHWLRRLGLSLLVLLFCAGAAAGAALHWLNGDTGRQWLETTVNDALKEPLEAAGMTLRIENLRGNHQRICAHLQGAFRRDRGLPPGEKLPRIFGGG